MTSMLLRLVAFRASCMLVFVASWGCSPDSYQMAPISGTIRLDGKPLPNATVGFEPTNVAGAIAGPGSYGRTDDQGRYQLMAPGDRPGAVVGMNKVWVRTYRAVRGAGEQVKQVLSVERLPSRYHDQTELTYEVPASGTEHADFELRSQ